MMLKCNNCNIVISELLSYVQHKHDVMDNVTLVKMCNSTFTEAEIVCAKDLLFESVTAEQRKKVKRRKEGKNQRNLDDIISFFKEVDPDVIPIFVARDLQKLPPISEDHLDMVTMWKDVTRLKNEINHIKENYATMAQVEELDKKWNSKKYDSIINMSCTNVNMRKRGGYYINSGPEALSSHVDDETTDITTESTRSSDNLSHSHNAYGARAQQGGMENAPVNKGCMSETEPSSHPGQGVCSSEMQAGISCMQNMNIVPTEKKQPSFSECLSNKNTWKLPKDADNKWTLVQRKRYRNRFIGNMGKAVEDSANKFKPAVTKIPLYISNVHKEVSESDIVDYIYGKTNEKVDMVKINMKFEKDYNSYKVYVNKNKLDVFLDDKLWPSGISFRRFVNIKERPKPQVIELEKKQIQT